MSASNQNLDVQSPYDLSTVATIALHSSNDAEVMLNQAADTFSNRHAWLSHHARCEILNKLAGLVSAEADDFAMLIAKEGGKPLTDAKVEVARAIDGIRLASKSLSSVIRGEEIPMGFTAASENRTAHTRYEPIGVVVAISAFNHPLNLIVHQVIPAVAVGCPVIVKPSLTTPLNCLRLVELLYEAGLPKAWCQVCLAENQVAELLVTSDKINFLTFIGSAKVGWLLKQKLQPGVRCALEHGGVAPVIVAQDANLEKAIPSIVKGAFYHAGQVCVSVQRVFVNADIAEGFSQQLANAASELKVGDAIEESTEVGPLILPREVDRVDAWVQTAIKGGAKLLTGGRKISETCYAPTVLFNPPADADVSTREIFGPVVCVYQYDDVQQAVKQANSLDVAFQAAVYTENIAFANNCVEQLDATAVMVNDHTAFRVDWMPFGGRRTSGYGMGGIAYTMHDMVQLKMAVYNHG